MDALRQEIDIRQVRRNFKRAASGYDAASFFQREINSRMLERLDYVKIAPTAVLDVGCGTGAALDALGERYPRARVLGVDASEAMLCAGLSQRSRLRWQLPFLRGHKALRVAGEARALPFRSASMGLVWSNLMLHWLDDPRTALREMHRVLEVGGLLMFSTLGPDTLKELRASFSDAAQHTQGFVDMHDYGDMLIECGYADPVMDVETLTLTYPTVDDFFRELRQNGGACVLAARRRGLMGRRQWAAMRERYERLRRDGRVPVTFEVVYGHAWKAEPKHVADGRAIVRFDVKRPGFAKDA